MRLVLLSDTHGRHHDLSVPEGDVLVHAGDFTRAGREHEVSFFAHWLRGLPHKHKVVIAGNHDMLFESRGTQAREALGDSCTYLQDSGVQVGGLYFYGSPWQPEFFDWGFNLPRGARLKQRWEAIPIETDVLVTHGPPRGVLDLTRDGSRVGCDDLRDRLAELHANEPTTTVHPRLHVFGHIHESAGAEYHDGTLYVNAAALDRDYEPTHDIRVVDIKDDGLPAQLIESWPRWLPPRD